MTRLMRVCRSRVRNGDLADRAQQLLTGLDSGAPRCPTSTRGRTRRCRCCGGGADVRKPVDDDSVAGPQRVVSIDPTAPSTASRRAQDQPGDDEAATMWNTCFPMTRRHQGLGCGAATGRCGRLGHMFTVPVAVSIDGWRRAPTGRGVASSITGRSRTGVARPTGGFRVRRRVSGGGREARASSRIHVGRRNEPP